MLPQVLPIRLRYKDAHLYEQFTQLPPLLKLIVWDAADYCQRLLGIDPLVTRIADPVHGESGVHLDWRALDIRDEFAPGKFIFTEKNRLALLKYINTKYPRNDKFHTIMWHSVAGSTHHFHIQISWDLADYPSEWHLRAEDLKRVRLKTETKENA